MTLVTYVKVGFAGYGPDLDPEDVGAGTIRDTCEWIRQELAAIADSEHDVASMYAEAGDFEDAWNTRELCDTMDVLAQNLDYDRRVLAPLYVNDYAALDATMAGLIAEHFPLDIEIRGSRRLYVWEADDDDV